MSRCFHPCSPRGTTSATSASTSPARRARKSTSATVTWLQLTWRLFRLTGESEYADEMERTVYNQLLGAQDPHNGNICYFTPLNGTKKATPGINCCVSSEPRGISMIPAMAWGATEKGPAIALY